MRFRDTIHDVVINVEDEDEAKRLTEAHSVYQKVEDKKASTQTKTQAAKKEA